MPMPPLPRWQDDDGGLISCTEKIKVMRENMQELYQTAQDAFEDALLMGCNEAQLRRFLAELTTALDNPYRPESATAADGEQAT